MHQNQDSLATMPTSWSSVAKMMHIQTIGTHIGMGGSLEYTMQTSIILGQGHAHQIPNRWNFFGYAGLDVILKMAIAKDGKGDASHGLASCIMKTMLPSNFSIQPSSFELFISFPALPLAGLHFFSPNDLFVALLKKKMKTGICFMWICTCISIYDTFDSHTLQICWPWHVHAILRWWRRS